MSTRIALVAATSVAVVAFLFVYPRGTEDLPAENERSMSPQGNSAEKLPDVAPVAAPSPAPSLSSAGALPTAPLGRPSAGPPSSQAKAHTPEELVRYIDRMGRSYRYAQLHLSQADVPGLVAILDDPDIGIRKWWEALMLLAFVDREEESVDALIAFIYRADDWERLSGPNADWGMLAKVDAINKLGLIGGDTATDALRLLFTEEGAKQYLSEWSDDAIAASSVSNAFVRGRAALGLVYTQDPTNLQLVEQFYRQTVLPEIRPIARGGLDVQHLTDEEFPQYLRYTETATAMAIRDCIESEGIETWKSVMADKELSDRLLSPYTAKYHKDLKEL